MTIRIISRPRARRERRERAKRILDELRADPGSESLQERVRRLEQAVADLLEET